MPTLTPTVFIVDDDRSVRESLEALIHSAGGRPETFASAGELHRLAGNQTDMRVITIMVERSGEVLRREAELVELRACYATLSSREREVMSLVIAGFLNKQIGGRLGISEMTVKVHRGRVMRKMGADSLPALVSMAIRLGFSAGTGYHVDITQFHVQ